MSSLPTYVLITPAHNEAAFIEKTIASMIRQTFLPLKWVIVDDGSSDDTADIVRRYLRQHPWIELVRRPKRKQRDFGGKAYAFHAGLTRVESLGAEVIGNVDADISFGPDHFEFLLKKLAADPTLGVVGTRYTQPGWDSVRDSFEGEASVSGACQLFRLKCFREIGGYRPHRAGGIDWIAVTTARMKGWKTRNYLERRFDHPRTMGTAERSRLGALFDYGRKDYLLGGSPIWEVFRAAYQATKAPIVLGGIALLAGFAVATFERAERPVSAELLAFHRREQMTRLRTIVRSLIQFRKPPRRLPDVTTTVEAPSAGEIEAAPLAFGAPSRFATPCNEREP